MTYKAKPPNEQSVLFITRKWPPAIGGMEVYSQELSQAYEKISGKTDIWALPGLASGHVPSKAALLLFLVKTAFKLIVRARRYDLIHFADFVLFPLAWIAKLSAPKTRRAISVHGLDLIYGRSSGIKPMLYRLFVRAAKMSPKTAGLTIANSKFTAKIAKDMGFNSCVVGYPGPSQSVPPEPLPACWPKPRTLLLLGRLTPRKGAVWFSQHVMPHLPNDVHYVVAGPRGTRKQERLLAESNTKLVRVFNVSDGMAVTMRKTADCMVMPNLPGGAADVEGFGIAVLDAKRDGATLLVSSLEGQAEAAQQAGVKNTATPGNAAEWITKTNAILARSAPKDDAPSDKMTYLDNWEKIATLALEHTPAR